jgi:hypothetical protein
VSTNRLAVATLKAAEIAKSLQRASELRPILPPSGCRNGVLESLSRLVDTTQPSKDISGATQCVSEIIVKRGRREKRARKTAPLTRRLKIAKVEVCPTSLNRREP